MSAASEAASEAIRSHTERIIQRSLEYQWQRWPGLRESLDNEQIERAREDTRFNLEFLTSALWAGDPALFSDYAAWMRLLFEGLRLPAEWVEGGFDTLQRAIADELSPELAEQSAAFMREALDHVRVTSLSADSFIDESKPHASFSARYSAALIAGDRYRAQTVIREALGAGVSVRDIYLDILQPAQYELGRLWLLNRLSVAHEHAATAITQAVMAQLYPRIYSGTSKSLTVVVACVGDELHELGARMVSDFFELDGWNAIYIGANTPPRAIMSAVRQFEPDVLALSTTMSFHVPQIEQVILDIHGDSTLSHVKVLVGGYPFNRVSGLWERVGADAWAPDAQAGVDAARLLVEQPARRADMDPSRKESIA